MSLKVTGMAAGSTTQSMIALSCAVRVKLGGPLAKNRGTGEGGKKKLVTRYIIMTSSPPPHLRIYFELNRSWCSHVSRAFLSFEKGDYVILSPKKYFINGVRRRLCPEGDPHVARGQPDTANSYPLLAHDIQLSGT